VGGLRLACNADRWTEVRRQATTAKSFGLEMHLLSPQEAQALWPLMTVEDVVGAAFLPTDGQASPSDITQALARGARSAGVTIREEVAVTGIEVEHGRVRGVVTDQGRIECERLVICAGLWSRALGRLAGVNIPLVPVRHQYVITERIDGVTPGLPTLRDPDRLTYYKEEVGGLVMGGYEPDPIPWAVDTAPPDLSFALIEEDWDHFEQLMTLALGRVPALETADVKQMISGPESFTPDGNFILGAAPEVRNVYVGCGFNAFGIASAGGRGWRWPSGSPRASHPTISGRSTSAASGATIWMKAGSVRERWKPTPSTTRWRGLRRSTAPAGRCAARRSTTGSRHKGPCSARSWAGSGRTGLRPRGKRHATSTPWAGRTGLRQ
jgi:sarcosine dehydrogenase